MTENKRFELRFIGGDTFIIDNETHINDFIGFGDVTDDFKCIVGLLNELHKENQALKQSDTIADLETEISKLKYENELLKDELEQCKAVIDNRWSEYLQKKGLIE